MEEGVVFLCVGMGVVYIFLSVMIWAMGFCAKLSAWLSKFFPEKVPVAKVKKNNNGDDEAAVAAAVAVASVQN